MSPYCPKCQTTGWLQFQRCHCYDVARGVAAILHEQEQLRGPHRIEECVIPDPEMTELLEWWDEWCDIGGEA